MHRLHSSDVFRMIHVSPDTLPSPCYDSSEFSRTAAAQKFLYVLSRGFTF